MIGYIALFIHCQRKDFAASSLSNVVCLQVLEKKRLVFGDKHIAAAAATMVHSQDAEDSKEGSEGSLLPPDANDPAASCSDATSIRDASRLAADVAARVDLACPMGD